MAGPEDLSALDPVELDSRIAAIRERMRPLEAELAELRAQRDVLLTEARRRRRLDQVHTRKDLRTRMRAGDFPSIADLVAGAEGGALDDLTYVLATGGEVRLGFPGARAQAISFTDGRQAVQARDLAEARRLHDAGWELGAPGRPGIRVHFPGTRLERLVEPSEVFARPR